MYRERIVYENLRASYPDMNEDNRLTLQHRCYRHLLRLIGEIIWGAIVPRRWVSRRIRFENAEAVLQEAKTHGAVIVMLGHIGNWEWAADFQREMNTIGGTQHNIYQSLHNRFFDRLMQRIRLRRGGALIEKRLLLRRMVAQRNDGQPKLYGMLCDQHPERGKEKLTLTFLNQSTPMLTGAEELSRRFDYPCWYLHIRQEDLGHYVCRFEPLKGQEYEGQDYPITRQYAELLEKNINEQPELWLWTHNRWRTVAAGKK